MPAVFASAPHAEEKRVGRLPCEKRRTRAAALVGWVRWRGWALGWMAEAIGLHPSSGRTHDLKRHSFRDNCLMIKHPSFWDGWSIALVESKQLVGGEITEILSYHPQPYPFPSELETIVGPCLRRQIRLRRSGASFTYTVVAFASSARLVHLRRQGLLRLCHQGVPQWCWMPTWTSCRAWS
jgi:hypothetical protein